MSFRFISCRLAFHYNCITCCSRRCFPYSRFSRRLAVFFKFYPGGKITNKVRLLFLCSLFSVFMFSLFGSFIVGDQEAANREDEIYVGKSRCCCKLSRTKVPSPRLAAPESPRMRFFKFIYFMFTVFQRIVSGRAFFPSCTK